MNSIEELKFASAWQDPIDIDDQEKDDLKITLTDESRGDFLNNLALGISKEIQFPINTIFLHTIGCVASAMTKSFTYQYYKSQAPVNIYVVTSHPPSTGKSGVHSFLSRPIQKAFFDFGKEQKKKRIKIEQEIKTIKGEVKDSSNPVEINMLSNEITLKEEKLEHTPVYQYQWDNITPESLEQKGLGQCGIWNVVSDEAGAINVLLGNIYGEGQSNNDFVLKSWDADYFSSGRITRDGGSGYVKGTISVIAQNETIETILAAGERGNGISERFLMLKEENMLGRRDFRKYEPTSDALTEHYEELVRSLVFSEEQTFTFSVKALSKITDNKMKIEPHMANGEKYSSNLLRGVVGKMDKQVMKISCVLHVLEHWKDGNKSLEINHATVEWAIKLYKELVKLYISAASDSGYLGSDAELLEIRQHLIKFNERKKQAVTFTDLKESIKGSKVFKGRPKLAGYIKKNLFVDMISMHWCTLVDGKVVINPKLR